MFIVPLTSSITPMETMSQKKQTESTDDGEATFFDVFESLVKNVKETDAQVTSSIQEQAFSTLITQETS